MLSHDVQEAMIKEAMSAFPAVFGLRAYTGVFRISAQSSYVNDHGVVQLYTEIERDGKWLSFCKGTAAELRREIIPL